jgi:serpin B
MRFRIIHSVALLPMLFFWLMSCKKDNSAVTHPLSLPSGGDAVIDASNQFAFNLFQAVLKQDPALNNKLVSPLSVYMALSMVYNGSANSTRDSIAKALQLNGISIDDLNALNKALIHQMPVEDSKVSIDIANSIWYNEVAPKPAPGFLNTVNTDYNGQVQSLDFNSTTATGAINSWVAQRTNNKIKSIFDGVHPADWMYLINTIYFNGAWTYAFEQGGFPSGAFTSPAGRVNVPVMANELKIPYGGDSTYWLINVPYGGGQTYDMCLLLPRDTNQSINDFAASFDLVKFNKAQSELYVYSVGLELPKWEYAYSIEDLRPHLTEMGMGIAFGDNADFSGMYSVPQGKLNISRAIHKTYIKVSEQGTEAAAATAVGVTPTYEPMIPLISFDHPFMYFLRERNTGAILFIGIVTDPRQS